MSALQIACPSCGSPVPFRSQATLYATCGNCRTILVRKDLVLEPVGEAGQLQPDGSLLRVGTQGTFKGKTFEIIGRMQIAMGDPKEPTGIWNEWCVSYPSGQIGWIGESYGEFFVSFPQATEGIVPYENIKVGDAITIGPTLFVAVSRGTGRTLTFEGELPFLSRQGFDVPFVDLRSATNVGATIDYSDDEPNFYLGEWFRFDELKFTGLRDGDDGQAFSAPSSMVSSFKCGGCGAAHEVKLGAISQSLVCEYCGTATDLTDPTYSKIYKANKDKASVPAVVPIGTKLKLPGENVEFECLGFLQKAVMIDGIQYYWSEYLLYEARNGFRWLVNSQGHWVFMEPLFHLPMDASDRVVGDPIGAPLWLDGLAFKHFQTTRARVTYAAGEFYWKVRAGETGVSIDYVCPPYMLSGDITGEDINWTKGIYLEPQVIYQAAGLKVEPAVPVGVFANQPNPSAAKTKTYWRTYLLFLVAGMVMMGLVGVASQKPVWQKELTYKAYEPERSQALPLELKGRTSNLKLKVVTTFDNRWAFFRLTLVNEATRIALDAGTTVSYYHDADGSYGSHTGDSLLPMIAPGNYTLLVEPQTGTGEAPEPNAAPPAAGAINPEVFRYTIEAYRDVPLWGFYFGFLFILVLPPLWVTYRSSQFETRRWAESDHAPVEDDDDDD